MPLPELPAVPTPARRLDPSLSQKLRFWSLAAMLGLVYVHACNLPTAYAEPWTLMREPLTFDAGLQFFLANALLRFRLPLLFAISGYLFARADDGRVPHGQRLRRRLRTLAVPYVLWAGLWLVAEAVLLPGQPLFGPGAGLASLPHLLARWLWQPVPYQFWFLRSLLLCNVLYPVLKKAILARPGLYFTLAGLLWFSKMPSLPLLEGVGLLFFGLGIWLARHEPRLQTAPVWFRPALFAGVWVGAAALKTWLAYQPAPPAGLRLPHQLLLLTLHQVGEAAGLLTAWFGGDALVRRAMARSWFRWLTGFSFIIYVLHAPTIRYVTNVALHRLAGLPHLPLLTYLAAPLLVVAGCVAVGAGLRAAAPGLYAVLTGGRGRAAP